MKSGSISAFLVSLLSASSLLPILCSATNGHRDGTKGMRKLMSRRFHQHHKRQADPTRYGLPTGSLAKNGIALGFYPEFNDPAVDPYAQTITQINAVLPSKTSLVGDFIQFSSSDTSLIQVDYHKADLFAQSNKPVYVPALFPTDGLTAFTSTQANAIAQKIYNTVSSQNITTWIRFAPEMNLDTNFHPWGQQPAVYIAAFKLMYDAVRTVDPTRSSIFLLWSPNYFSGDQNSIGGYNQYYPGDGFVDLVGLSSYSYVVSNSDAAPNQFVNQLTTLTSIYGYKPVVVSETSHPYYYVQDTMTPISIGDTAQSEIKINWLQQATDSSLLIAVPNLKAVVWFNYIKDEEGYTKDFRLVLGDQATQAAAVSYLS